MSDSPSSVTTGTSNPEQNLDKLIAHQEKMFNLSMKAELAKSSNDINMSLSRKIGDSAQKA
ncbi:hypothetical protein [Nitratireductor soli]|uniref:hypothetical protein n=1 Tax=Nitratireductor soli TaxID=1670619 RepID=UPI000AC7275D|nr:hypothetical protein [Nitratireductor soli]